MDIKYSPKDIESNIYKKWTENDCFSAKDLKSNYSIVLPPPNVTGTLHMGHAFQHTIIDILKILGKHIVSPNSILEPSFGSAKKVDSNII